MRPESELLQGAPAEANVDRLRVEAERWAEIVGPCYTQSSLDAELHLGPVEIEKTVSDLQLLRLVTADGVDLYPAFQIRNGALVEGMRPVLTALRLGTDDRWMWAQWLNTPVLDHADATAGETPWRRNIERLIAGEADAVVLAAEQTAASWSS